MEGTETLNSSTSEFIAASFNTSSTKKPIIMGCLYRPTDKTFDYTSNLCQEIRILHSQNRYNIIWIGGDANLSDVAWTSNTIIGYQYSIHINETFINTIIDTANEQIVSFPTRNEIALDIFCTNRLTIVKRCLPMPGLK
ncbi:hypothetical protein DPMN_176507 [Dreissena polymorpha]|uniref:Endonuclease/exonuclease/phosphatase domain-containing protein n=1 Tax=Dreissena polymorpha TaxID=45954 RepID=A0A9D4EB46_DREPO|nr:hypothetical protein DPMN_176507 [Dreissena polymorpha]